MFKEIKAEASSTGMKEVFAIKTIVLLIINYVIYNITRWTFFSQLTHTADDAKEQHVSQVQEDKWNNITKSCVYFHFKTFH